jgi:hypothetical protein
MPPLTRKKAAERDRPDLGAHEPQHRMAHRIEHPPHLAVPPLVEHQLDHAGPGLWPLADAAGAGRRRRP